MASPAEGKYFPRDGAPSEVLPFFCLPGDNILSGRGVTALPRAHRGQHRGYITVQLALGGWLGEHPLSSPWSVAGIAIIDFTLAFIAATLLRRNYQRRGEVVATLTNVMEALGFQTPGLFLPDRSINVSYRRMPWGPWFILGVVVGYVGLLLVLIGGVS